MNLSQNIIKLCLGSLLYSTVCCSTSKGGDELKPPTPPIVETSDVDLYVTKADRSMLFEQVPLQFGKNNSMSPYAVTLKPETRYQSVVGFGAAVTGSTGYNLLKMSQADRTALLKEIFDPTTGLGSSFVRVSIGSSDFGLDEYTCCDKQGIDFFEIHPLDKRDVLPVLHEIMAINPAVKIVAAPWSCPRWMKIGVDNSAAYDRWTSGRLNPKYYADYADYFVMWVQAMEAEGLPIYALTPQNEPLNHGNSMSLYMPWQEQLAFIKTALGPAFRKHNLATKILVFDHNYNYDGKAEQNDYPMHIFEDAEASQYIDGSAWHNYGGNVAELDRVHAAYPDKSIFFTEASIGTWNYSFDGCLLNDFESIFLGTLSRYGKGVTLWNWVLDQKGAPNRPGGCNTCYGAIEINSADYKTLDRKSHYYDIAHCSKVIRPDAVRIATSGFTAAGISYLAFENTDGTYAFVVLNRNEAAQSLTIADGNHTFKYDVPAKAIASFRWKK